MAAGSLDFRSEAIQLGSLSSLFGVSMNEKYLVTDKAEGSHGSGKPVGWFLRGVWFGPVGLWAWAKDVLASKACGTLNGLALRRLESAFSRSISRSLGTIRSVQGHAGPQGC